jgi:methyl-accepting chemotaxis protein
LVGETGRSLTQIAAQIAEINTIVAEIAASAEEQATALHQVNTSVNQMDQVTQQNAAMVEESTAASHSLAQEAEALWTVVGQFRVGEGTAANQAPARKPAARSTVAVARPMAVSGNLALKASAEPGWEEF